MLGRDEKVPQFRLTVVQYSILAVFLFLAFGLWQLQISRSDYYANLAEQNRVKQVPILAPRGKILDREGRVIVDNYPSFSVLMLRDQRRDLLADAEKIAEGLHLDPNELRTRLKRMAGQPGYQPLFVKDDITPDELAWVEAHRAELPELDTITVHRRLYPRNGFMAHLIGYVGEVSESMLNQPEWELYDAGDIVGKSGVELYYNDILMGTNGSRQVIVNNRGKEVGTLSAIPVKPGKPLKLTIDLDIQIAAEEALGENNGGIVAMDPRTGEILAMASRPIFDPNVFSVRVSRSEWNRLVMDPSKPLLNKAIQAQLAPGSTFKIIMAVAGMQEGIAGPLTVNCPGGATFYGRFFKCWIKSKGRGHGTVGLNEAIAQSCDVYFYTLGERLGIGRIAKYATAFGLGQKTGVDLPQEVSGVMPSEQWKIRNFKQKWYAGETISVSIGQGAVATTPIQMARSIGAIAMGGTLRRPHVAFPSELPSNYREAIHYDEESRIPIDQHAWEAITNAMADVTTAGTAAGSRLTGIDFAGKTGSAQTVSNMMLAKMGAAEKARYKDNGWFVGVAPRRNPEIVVSVLVEGGEHGSDAARLAAKVIKAYVEKQRRVRQNPAAFAVAVPAPSPAASPKVTPAVQNETVSVGGVWNAPRGDHGHEHLQSGNFNVPLKEPRKPLEAAPGMVSANDTRERKKMSVAGGGQP